MVVSRYCRDDMRGPTEAREKNLEVGLEDMSQRRAKR
jgi:hypothetical protein